MGKHTVFFLPGFLKYLPKYMVLLGEKVWRKKKIQNPFPATLRQKKKFFISLSQGGGVKALMNSPLIIKKNFF